MKICKNCNIEYESGKFCKKCGSPLVDKDEQALVCVNCGSKLEPGVKFCSECGTKVAPQKLLCSGCGMELKPGVKFCPECGTKVGEGRKEEAPKVDEKVENAEEKQTYRVLDPSLLETGRDLYKRAADFEDEGEKFRFYLESSRYDYGPAFYQIADSYESGTGVEKNYEKAQELYKEAFALLSQSEFTNDPEVFYYLGNCYYLGEGTDEDNKKAFYYTEIAARMGHVQAQNDLGDMYKLGEGVAQDSRQAFRWYEKAALQDNIDAQTNIGECFLEGEGTRKDENAAKYWLKKAIARGSEDALNAFNHYFYKTVPLLKYQGTDDTPTVILDILNQHFEISGRSLPEDVVVFYKPILEWLDMYKQNPLEKMVFNFKLEYFNTASSKLILDVLLKLEDIASDGNDVLVRWHYPDDDLDMEESGEEYSDIVEVPFEQVPYTIL